VERQIEEKHVKTGAVRFGFQHFPFLGDESQWAAEASECAHEQGKFWEYHDLLYARQNGENRGAFKWITKSSLTKALSSEPKVS